MSVGYEELLNDPVRGIQEDAYESADDNLTLSSRSSRRYDCCSSTWLGSSARLGDPGACVCHLDVAICGGTWAAANTATTWSATFAAAFSGLEYVIERLVEFSGHFEGLFDQQSLEKYVCGL